MSGNRGAKNGVSKHAHKRFQQRASPPLVVGLLEQYGSTFRSGDGDILCFDRKARKRLSHALGGPRGLKPFECYLSAYVVLSDDGTLVTGGHRFHRIYR